MAPQMVAGEVLPRSAAAAAAERLRFQERPWRLERPEPLPEPAEHTKLGTSAYTPGSHRTQHRGQRRRSTERTALHSLLLLLQCPQSR